MPEASPCYSRNGKYPKTVISENGPIELEVPRDCNCEFEPRVIKKGESRLGELEDIIISMYAKGMTTRDIQAHIEDIYRANISSTLVSYITDKIRGLATEFQNRHLEPVYPIVFFDAIHYKVRDENSKRTASKAAYTCLGINLEG